jgi:hypothetical protein
MELTKHWTAFPAWLVLIPIQAAPINGLQTEAYGVGRLRGQAGGLPLKRQFTTVSGVTRQQGIEG